MPFPPLRNLINWRLLATHLLAVFFLTLGIRQFMLLRVIDVLTVYQDAGFAGVQHMELKGRWDSAGELVTYLHYVRLLPPTLAGLIGCALSWVVVTRLRERRAIPVLVFLTNLLVSRQGLYRPNAVTHIEEALRWPLTALSLPAQLWVAGFVLTTAGLLLVAVPLLVRKRPATAPASLPR